MATVSQVLLLGIIPIVLLFTFQDAVFPYFRSFSDSLFPVPTTVIDRSQVPIVAAAISHYAHAEKVVGFAKGLAEIGYPVTFVSGAAFENMVANTTVKFQAVDGPPTGLTDEEWAKVPTLTPLEVSQYLPTKIFLEKMDGQVRTIQSEFEKKIKEYGRVVYFADASFFGHLPQQLGAPGIRPTLDLGLGIANVPFDSKDAYAFPSDQPPDTSADRVRLHRESAAYKNNVDPEISYLSHELAKYASLNGAVEQPVGFYNMMGRKNEYFMAIGVPEYEFPRSDLEPKVVYVGSPAKPAGNRKLPSWWKDIEDAKKAGKKLVVCSQGSHWMDKNGLLIPTLKALKGRDDLIVVATTVDRPPEQVEGLEVPSNARVAQFVPFDIIMPLADVAVISAGFGSVMQSIAAGVPMVLAGQIIDKLQNSMLAAHRGVAINLKTEHATEEQVLEAVTAILGDGNGRQGNATYKAKVMSYAEELKKYDTMKIVDETIMKGLSEKLRKA